MRIVASSAPQLTPAAARAGAQRQLLRVTDDFEGAAGAMGVNGEHLFEPLAGTEVVEVHTGIGDTRYAGQVALFANAVARRRRQFGGVDDGSRRRFSQVLFRVAVAAFARDGLFHERRTAVAVYGAGNVLRPAGVAE